MAFALLHFYSEFLGKQTAANVFVPQGVSGPFATLVLLHGLNHDNTTWQRFTRLESYLEELRLPLLVVMPDGERGFYTDGPHSAKFESAITEELVPLIDATFRTSEKRAIGGFSMGGYGALKLALKYPEMFVSANAHAGGVMWPRKHAVSPYQERRKHSHEWLDLLDDQANENDIWPLAQHAVSLATRPALRLDCGTEDYLIEENRALHSHLNQIGYAHEYFETAGAHTGSYWDARIRAGLQFHARHLFA